MAQANPHPPAALVRPTTYVDLYHGMPDVLGGQYAQFLAPFSAESNDQPAQLRERVLGAARDVPKVFAMFQEAPTPRIVFVHRPTKFAPSLTGATPWDSKVYGFHGDLLAGNQVNLVEWPAAPFARSAPVVVPTFATFDDAWAAAGPVATMMGPFAAGAPNTEAVRTRFLCPIPHQYVRLCLNRSHTPRSFWTEVIGQIRADDAAQDCSVVVDFARVAAVCGPLDEDEDDADPTYPLMTAGVLQPPLMDAVLSDRRWGWVLEDLPALPQYGRQHHLGGPAPPPNGAVPPSHSAATCRSIGRPSCCPR